MAKILIVDDDRSILMVCRAILESGGHEVVTTTDSNVAVELAIGEQVDAAVLDVMMPGRSGLSILSEMRSRPETEKLPVLMLSELGEGSDRVRGLRSGADDYMPKPLEPEELLLRLNHLLALTASARAKLGGSLEDFSIQEMLHNLYHGSRAGILHVESDGIRGSINISDGFLGHANWDRFTGSDAVLAMMRLRRGRFRFDPSPALSPPLQSGDTLGSILDIVMHGAWIEDELFSRPGLRPHSRLFSECDADARISVPAEFENLPLRETLRAIRDTPGLNLVDLVEAVTAAPQRLCLAVVILGERSYLRIETGDG